LAAVFSVAWTEIETEAGRGDRDGGEQMGILTDDMKRLVDEQKLAFGSRRSS